LHKYVAHVMLFLEDAKAGNPIYQETKYEKSHLGDDILFCPEFSKEMEIKIRKSMKEVLDRHLPKSYAKYTASAHQEENAPLINAEYVTMHTAQEFLQKRELIRAESMG